MNAGTLKYVIDIYGKTGNQNTSGYVDGTNEPRYTLRAKRTDAGAREIWEAYAAQVSNVVNWECRNRDGVEAGMEVAWGGNRYEIIAVQRPAGVPRRMILKTTLKEAK